MLTSVEFCCSQQERLDFLYESGLGVGKPSEAAPPSTEEYLLGKPVEEASKTEAISKVRVPTCPLCLPVALCSSLFRVRGLLC